MSASCPHCDRVFTSTRGIFGQEASLQRDAHVPVCEANPRNRCFCGAIFPNSLAKENHAQTCEKNPANRFKCPHCPQEFVTTFGIMGRRSADGKALRDAHAVGCKDNPANTCFCGNLFPNPDARNAHAVHCDQNPANHYDCQFCKAHFVKTFTIFGFCSNDGRAERDAHQLRCEKNPKNICFCDRVFPNPTARDKHAQLCQLNPVNRFECSHCRRLFTTRYGLMGRVVSDGKSVRDAHEVGCQDNPSNKCFCGQLFLNPSARDAHAVRCEMNPANRFSCQHCRKTFVATFGMFASSGAAERDAHMLVCTQNPANATCPHCDLTFARCEGPFPWANKHPRQRCEAHIAVCERNPQNRHECQNCGACFVTKRRWMLCTSDGRRARDKHCATCDVIPCDYEVKDADIGDWLLMSPGGVESLGGGDDGAVECGVCGEIPEEAGELEVFSDRSGSRVPVLGDSKKLRPGRLSDEHSGASDSEVETQLAASDSTRSPALSPAGLVFAEDLQSFHDAASSIDDDASERSSDPEEEEEEIDECEFKTEENSVQEDTCVSDVEDSETEDLCEFEVEASFVSKGLEHELQSVEAIAEFIQ